MGRAPSIARCRKLCPVLAALLMSFSGCGGTNERVVEETFERLYTVEPNVKITIQNRGGAVMVYGSDANELRVQAVKKAYSRERLRQITIDVARTPGTVSVTTKFPPQPKWALSDRSGTVDYTIVVPATASISALDLRAGEVVLDAMRGREARVRLGDGRIFARACFTDLDLTINRGTLILSYEWWEDEMFSAEVIMGKGNAWVWLPGDAAFHLLSNVTHGKIANDFNELPVSNNPDAAVRKIDQIVNGGGEATIKIRVDEGKIRIGEANP
jgi:hypothetical protein